MTSLSRFRRLNAIFLGLGLSGLLTFASEGRAVNRRSLLSVVPVAGVIEIADPSKYSQVAAISDVHGMFDPLVVLLRASKIIDAQNKWIAGKTLLVVVGDSIDKGPKSVEALDLWIDLQSQAADAGGLVVHTLGNHEAEFLADPLNDKKAAELMKELRDRHIPVTDLTSTETPRGRFLHGEPVALKVGRWLFSHSGFYTSTDWGGFTTHAQQVLESQRYGDAFLIGDTSILGAKDWEKDGTSLDLVLKSLDAAALWGSVFGHQPDAFKIRGRSAAKKGGRLIKIDNGMAPEAGSYAGSLLVFTAPAQMLQPAYPQVKVVSPDGSTKLLQPE